MILVGKININLKEASMTRKTLGVLMFLLLLLPLTIWSGGQDEVTAEKVKLVFWFPSANPTNDAYFNSLGPDFMKMNPDIEIEDHCRPLQLGGYHTETEYRPAE